MSNQESLPRDRYPLLPLKNVVIFPRNVVTLLVGRARSIQAVEEALAADRRVVVTAQRDVQQDEPLAEHLYSIGTMGEIVQVERQQGGNVQVVLEGVSRAQLVAIAREERLYTARVVTLRDTDADSIEARVLVQHVKELVGRYAESKNRLTAEVTGDGRPDRRRRPAGRSARSPSSSPRCPSASVCWRRCRCASAWRRSPSS